MLSFTDVRLYDLLNSKELLSLGHSNRHDRFFRNLIEARNTEEGRKAIEEYAKSDAENPPDLANGSGEKLLEYITYFNLRYLDSLVRTPVENGRNRPETG